MELGHFRLIPRETTRAADRDDETRGNKRRLEVVERSHFSS